MASRYQIKKVHIEGSIAGLDWNGKIGVDEIVASGKMLFPTHKEWTPHLSIVGDGTSFTKIPLLFGVAGITYQKEVLKNTVTTTLSIAQSNEGETSLRIKSALTGRAITPSIDIIKTIGGSHLLGIGIAILY